MTSHHAHGVPLRRRAPDIPTALDDTPPPHLLSYVRTRYGMALGEVAEELRLRVKALATDSDEVTLPSALEALREVVGIGETLRDLERLLIETCMDDSEGSWAVIGAEGYGASREVAQSRYRKSDGTRTWSHGRPRKHSGTCVCGHPDDDHRSRRRGPCRHVVDEHGSVCSCAKYTP